MNVPQISPITICALMRLYQIGLRAEADGTYSGHLPWSINPTDRIVLSADGGSWHTLGKGQPEGGDRLDFIMRMECVTRERASEMLYNVYPQVFEREKIKPGLTPQEPYSHLVEG